MATTPVVGPDGYENWRAAISGHELRGYFEVLLYSDADLRGHIHAVAPCPYSFLSTISFTKPGKLAPHLALRVAVYVPPTLPNMKQTDTSRYHGGWLADEVAALVALIAGVRVQAGAVVREFYSYTDDPLGAPRAEDRAPVLPPPHDRHGLRVPRLIRETSLNDVLEPLWSTYTKLSPENANALVRAARLNQDAVWVAESEPQLAWLFLVSAVECVATEHQATQSSPRELLSFAHPKVAGLLKESGGDALLDSVAHELRRTFRATARFVSFILDHLPPPPERPEKCWPIDWKPSGMTNALKLIYEYRSVALHDGTPFPAPMSEQPIEGGTWCEAPGGLATSTLGAVWMKQDLPMLLQTFEYIARNSILNWWRSLTLPPSS